ncbi:MAG: fumarylacetoacetate hydrolase family protein, partial [Vicinamibacteria bacterium]
MKLYRRRDGVAIETEKGNLYSEGFSFDQLFQQSEPSEWLRSRLSTFEKASKDDDGQVLPPLEGQEVWAAGVTYRRSREARMEESGNEADVYDRVYRAERPELFFKATPHRVVGHEGEVGIRSDSAWNVPEAELALAITSRGLVFGYSIGNDMSSRSIEGENPLYLPQAKIYDGSCALGPCLLVTEEPLPSSTEISIRVGRRGGVAFEGKTRLSEMKRRPSELAGFLFRDNSFPNGCYLLTGTG